MALTASQTRVLRELRDGSRQAQDVARRLAIDTSAAYRHLETLRRRGLVGAQTTAEGRGRPKKQYHLTDAGWETFPRDYAFLLSALIDRIVRTDGRAAFLAHLDGIAEDLGAPLAAEPDVKRRLRNLLALYNELGFEARLERTKDRTSLVQRNCPFLRVARADPEALCACLDEGILRAALPGASVTLRASLAKGDSRCRHEIRF